MPIYPSTTHPPDDDDDDAQQAADEKLPWVLLEHFLYVAKRENATTAYSDARDGPEIQLTVCARPPPRVSYVCVHSSPWAGSRVEDPHRGPDATIAFVDLWNGILFCDIRKLQQHHHQADGGRGGDDDDDDAIPILSYVPVPDLLDKEHKGDARLWRNIALIGGRLKYVELKRQWDRSYTNVLCQRHRGDELVPWHRPDGWVAVTFSRSASSSMDEGWRQD
ncbi:hypothetical protein HU200_046544 [Digitaria exilis]|uniref:DUF1618 domain-containing protein n=1 Tax=Digitaria exilis TaxID=1010633 RepID=A0A835B3S2_9POAL|nr:hypothetical protein HU200_046544 [Digitaria exilis]